MIVTIGNLRQHKRNDGKPLVPGASGVEASRTNSGYSVSRGNRREPPATHSTPMSTGFFGAESAIFGNGAKRVNPGTAPLDGQTTTEQVRANLAKPFGSSGAFRATDKLQGGLMLRLLPVSIIFLMIGCSSITQRFDALSQRMGDTNEQIRQMNVKLDETNRHLT